MKNLVTHGCAIAPGGAAVVACALAGGGDDNLPDFEMPLPFLASTNAKIAKAIKTTKFNHENAQATLNLLLFELKKLKSPQSDSCEAVSAPAASQKMDQMTQIIN